MPRLFLVIGEALTFSEANRTVLLWNKQMQFALKCFATTRSITYCERKGMQTALRKSMGRIDFGRGIAVVKLPQMRNNIAF